MTTDADASPGNEIRLAIKANNFERLNELLVSSNCTPEVLLERDIQNNNSTALHLVVQSLQIKLIKVLLDSPFCTIELLNAVNSHGATALHLAVESGSIEMVRDILNHKNCTNECILAKAGHAYYGYTALHHAVIKKHTEIVELFLDSKPEPLILEGVCRPSFGAFYTADTLAVYYSNTQMISLFLTHPSCTQYTLERIKASSRPVLGVDKIIALCDKKFEYITKIDALITALTNKIEYFKLTSVGAPEVITTLKKSLSQAKQEYSSQKLTPELQVNFEKSCIAALEKANSAEIKTYLQFFRGGILKLIDSFLKFLGYDVQAPENRQRFFVPQTTTEKKCDEFEAMFVAAPVSSV